MHTRFTTSPSIISFRRNGNVPKQPCPEFFKPAMISALHTSWMVLVSFTLPMPQRAGGDDAALPRNRPLLLDALGAVT